MEKITIYTDGSSKGNPGPGGFGSIIIDGEKVREIGGKEDHTTNNRMEMKAVIEALKSIKESSQSKNIEIYTDSSYLLNGITKWVYAWQRNNWITKTKEAVMNKDLWIELLEVQNKKNISWQKVSGHSGHVYNDRCDTIATNFADNTATDLFKGSLDDYQDKILKHQKTRIVSSKKGEAYSYVSLVNDKIKVDKTWKECEERVKGVRGAKYKKATSLENEKEIVEAFRDNYVS